jgi:hypothetical protein
VSELERNLRLVDAVLKYQTLKLDREQPEGDVAADEVEFQHVEISPDEEPEQTLAQRLGLAAPHYADRRDDDRGDDDRGFGARRGRDGGDDDDDSGDVIVNPVSGVAEESDE